MNLMCWLFLAALASAVPLATAQDAPEFETGLKPYGTYQGGDIDNISLTNGNLSIIAPLWSYPQRGGKLSWDFNLLENAKNWQLKTHCDRFGNCTTYVATRPPGGSATIGSLQSITHGSSMSCSVTHPGFGTHNVTLSVAMTGDGSTHVLGATPSGLETLDGSGIHYDSTADIYTDRGGIRYTGLNSTPPSTHEDPNGNEVSFNVSTQTWTDTLGRTTTAGTAATCPTGNGLLPVSSVSPLALPGPSSAGGTTQLTQCYATVSLSTNFPDADTQFNGTATYLQSVVLPNGTAWSLEYDSYGNIIKILFPDGASLSYTWTTEQGVGQDSRYVISRTLDANDGTGGHTWNYNWGNFVFPNGVTVTDPLGDDVVYTFTYFGPSPYVTLAQYYQGSSVSGTLLKTVATDYTSTAIPYVGCSGSSSSAFGVMPIRVTTTMGGKVSKVEMDHDGGFAYNSPDDDSSIVYTGSYGDVVARREYDYGSGAPGGLTRQTITGYLALSNTNYTTNNLVDLPSSVGVYDGAWNQKASTTYGYDAATPIASGITIQHDSNPLAGAYRGNQTSVGRWLNTTGGTLTSTATFYDTGTVYQSADPLGHQTTYAYSPTFAGAYATSLTDPMGHATGYSYDFNTGLYASVTDVNSQPTSYSYDAMWRTLQITYPTGGGSASFSYVDSSSPSMTLSRTITSGTNYVKTATLDGVGRVRWAQVTSDPDGVTTVGQVTYDAAGRKATLANPWRLTTDPTYGITYFGYDALTRVTSVASPSGGSVTTSYADNCATVTDQQGKARQSCMDGLGRLTQVFEPDPVSGSLVNETDYTYDTLDNLTSVLQSGSRQRTFVYDSLSRLTSAANPESGTTLYTYNNDSLLTSKQDARGIITNYASYDADHFLLSKTYSDTTPAVAYTYNQAACLGQTSCSNIHHRTSMTDGPGSEAWAYDTMGRAVVDQRTTNNVTQTFIYNYNFNGSINTLTYPSTRVIPYVYNGAGRPTSATSNGGYIVAENAVYAPHGELSTLNVGVFRGWSMTESHTYNNRLQPVNTTIAISGGATVQNVTYNFVDASGHNNGNVMSITNNLDGTRTQAFTYDQLNRVLTAGTSAWSQTFTDDIWSNLYNVAATGGATGLNVGIDPSTNRISGLGYDAAGNMTSDGLYNYVYNAENQQSTAAGVNYTYDGDGKRVMKSNGTLYWYGAGSQVLSATDLTGSNYNDYIYFGGRRIGWARASDGAGFHYFQDQLGSFRVIVQYGGGAACYDADFYPYGGERVVTNTCPQNYKFAGMERDTETDNDHAQFRQYPPNLGRWMTPDPAGMKAVTLTDPQTWNMYAYARNNPTTLTDPSGLETPDTIVDRLLISTSTGLGFVIGATAGGAGGGVGGTLVEPVGGTLMGLGSGAWAGGTLGAAIGNSFGRAILNYAKNLKDEGSSKNSQSQSSDSESAAKSTMEKEGAGDSGDKGSGLRQQIQEHEQRLEDYKQNPDAHDNKGFLKDASPERRAKIIESRVKSLERQIETFKKDLKTLDEHQ